MTTDVPVPLVWLAPQPPDAGQTRSLEGWASSQRVALAAPRDERPSAIRADPSVAAPIEDMLDRAYDAIAERDVAGVERSIAGAESLLRAHPELPQAAWLMAEVLRARATRWRKVFPRDVEAADAAWERAEALDGGRVAAIGEVVAPRHPPEALVWLALRALRDGDQTFLDGSLLPRAPRATAGEALPIPTRAGLHVLVVATHGAPVWARWVDVSPGSSTVDVDAPDSSPCSTSDTSTAALARPDGGSLEAARADDVRCPTWVAAAPGRVAGMVRVAKCRSGRCDPFVEWQWQWPSPAPLASTPPSIPPPGWGGEAAVARSPLPLSREARAARKAVWPAWATWVLAGAGVALAAGVVVVASGALQPAPPVTRFVSGGIDATPTATKP